jgi:hypothetical protein
VVRARVRGADGRPGAGLAGDRDRAAHADLRADRLGEDARGVPLGTGPARREPSPADPKERRTRLVYVSPLKALSYDVEKNLRAPLRGIGGEISVGIARGTRRRRSGATWSVSRPTC